MKVTKSLLIAVCVGLMFAGMAMWATWQHDVQCNIHCNDVIQWEYWLVIGASWFVAGLVAAFSASLFTGYLVRSWQRPGAGLR